MQDVLLEMKHLNLGLDVEGSDKAQIQVWIRPKHHINSICSTLIKINFLESLQRNYQILAEFLLDFLSMLCRPAAAPPENPGKVSWGHQHRISEDSFTFAEATSFLSIVRGFSVQKRRKFRGCEAISK